MTRAERQDGSPAHQPKPSWGPGKNAALSFAAFAAIFGIFAYAERDTTVGHASVTHDISGAIGTAVGKTRNAIMTLASHGPATGKSGTSAGPAGPDTHAGLTARAAAAGRVDVGRARGIHGAARHARGRTARRGPLPMPSRNSGSRRMRRP